MGMVFYELATLRHPFHLSTDDSRAWKDAHLYRPVEPPDKLNTAIPPGISQVILKMVEKSTQKRAGDWKIVSSMLNAANRGDSINNPLIAGMMKKRIDADAAARSERLLREKKSQEREEFGKLVISQALQTVIRPLEEFFGEFNRQCLDGQITMSVRIAGASL